MVNHFVNLIPSRLIFEDSRRRKNLSNVLSGRKQATPKLTNIRGYESDGEQGPEEEQNADTHVGDITKFLALFILKTKEENLA